MTSSKIWLSPPSMSNKELDYVRDAIKSNWVAPVGPYIQGFESDIIRHTNCGNAAVVSSGTSAIHLALILLGVQSGDEVIASTFTFSATINPILYLGATPILVESESQTWNMSPVFLKQAIEQRMARQRKPKAIILVHLYGMPALMDEIISIANSYDIPIIEDAAEALGSKYGDRSLGTFGKIGVYSFNGNKIITTSGGGALVSADNEIVERAKFLASQAREPVPHYEHKYVGYNYRMSNVCAAIGRAQIESLEHRIERKRSIFKRYKELLGTNNGIMFLDEPSGEYFSNRWLTTVTLNKNVSINREELIQALARENIDARPLWKPMHLQPVFEGLRYYGDRQSDELFDTGLCLPSGVDLEEGQILRIAEIIKTQLK